MLPEVDKAGFTPIEIPKAHRNPWAIVKIVAAILVVGGVAAVWFSGYRPPMLQASTKSSFELVEADRGDVNLYVVDTGSIESASNIPIRCEVEALIGLIGGSQGTTGKTGSTSSSSQGADSSSGQSGSGSGSGTDASAAATKTKTAKKKVGASSSASRSGSTSSRSSSSSKSSSSSSSSSSGSSSSSSSSSSGSGSSKSGSGGSSGGSGSSSSSSSSSASSSGTTSTAAVPKPVLESFSYMVTPYTPARPTTTKKEDTTSKKKSDSSQGKGGRGGGGGGGRGGRGGGGGRGSLEEEKPGSTRIVTIKPEGTRVKAGDVVAELDKSSYVEEERTQKIRYLQAQSYVEQARAMLEVAQITLREYRDGIYPQDSQLIRQYIDSCKIARERAANNLKWSEGLLKMNFRTPFQVKGDRLSLEQTEVALQEGEGMLKQLTRYTAPKIIKSLEANVAAIEADLLTQEAAFELEKQRLTRLQRNIEHCTVKAPADGVVVYANEPDRWGMVTTVIDEGVTLREKQPIFNLPDPQHMRVKAKINESKVALVQTGQPVLVLVDAFPDKPLKGVVAEVTPISIPLRGSDVRVYYANIDITEGNDSLRPGLSAEVLIQVERRRNVTRVPIDAIRWVSGRPYVAVFQGGRDEPGHQAWRWQPIEVGLSDPSFAEVTSGLKPGERVIAHPDNLPAPAPEKVAAR